MPIPIPIDKVITPRYLSVSGLDAGGQPTTRSPTSCAGP